MLNQKFTSNGTNYNVFVDQENPFQHPTNQNERTNIDPIESEPIPTAEQTYQPTLEGNNFLCKDFKCTHLNDILCVVCVACGALLSWAFTVTFVFPYKHMINTSNTTNISF